MGSPNAVSQVPDFEAAKQRIKTFLDQCRRDAWRVAYENNQDDMRITIGRDEGYLFDVDDAFALAFCLHETTSLEINESGKIVASIHRSKPVVYTGSKIAAMRNRIARILGTLIPATDCCQKDGEGDVTNGTWTEAWEHWDNGMKMFFDQDIVKEEQGVDGYWYVKA